MGRVQKSAAAPGGHELSAVVGYVAAVMMRISGNQNWDRESPFGFLGDTDRVIHDAPGLAVGVGVKPTGLSTAQDDFTPCRHMRGDDLEIIRLRLVHVVGQLDISRPQPPRLGNLKCEVAAPLTTTPATKVQRLLPAEIREKEDQPVIPIVIARNCEYRDAVIGFLVVVRERPIVRLPELVAVSSLACGRVYLVASQNKRLATRQL